MCFGSPKKVAPPAPPPPAPEPVAVTAEADLARKEQKSKSARNQGRKSTILTGPQGIQDNARTAGKTLLGQ